MTLFGWALGMVAALFIGFVAFPGNIAAGVVLGFVCGGVGILLGKAAER
jgi:hypothetical protein